MDWTHANMGFINFKWPWLLRDAWVLEYKFLLWIEKDSIKNQTFTVLTNVSCPSRVLISFMIVRLCYLYFVPLTIFQKRCSIGFSFKYNSPYTELILLALVLIPVPVVEVTKLLAWLRQWQLTIESPFAAGAHSLYVRSPFGSRWSPNRLYERASSKRPPSPSNARFHLHKKIDVTRMNAYSWYLRCLRWRSFSNVAK